ncbi:hypothetical protein [Stenotrophomonas rhizophila]|uniref:hypothetical protein n=1 Tax=Stenotrophomonas rhizophila TaxID=216778 RepID=UPI0015C51EB6|nr:hypothetical protein [Stenotrophomonas rhizophila]
MSRASAKMLASCPPTRIFNFTIVLPSDFSGTTHKKPLRTSVNFKVDTSSRRRAAYQAIKDRQAHSDALNWASPSMAPAGGAPWAGWFVMKTVART